MVESSKPKKQRRAFHKMPMHKRQKSISATLSKPLRKSLGKRSLSLRKGDQVRVMRGKHKGTEAKVASVNYMKMQVFLEKLMIKKADGTEKALPLHASNLMITDIDKSDARRAGKGIKAEKKEASTEKKAKKEEKPAAKATTEKKPAKAVKKEKPTAEKTKKETKKVKKDGKKG